MKNVLFAVCVFAASFLNAQETPTQEAQPISRGENLKRILGKTYLSENYNPLLNMLAGEAMQECQKAIDPEELIRKFRDLIKEEKTLAKFSAPYASFSDQEIAQLRELHEMPIYQKFSDEGVQIFKGQMAALKETFKELVEKNGRELAANSVVEVSSGNYKSQVNESQMPVILEVYATWCGACRSMDPTFRELSAKYKDTIRFAKVNYDAEPAIAKQYNVSLLPTFIFLKPGNPNPALKMTGGMSQTEFEAQINQFLAK